jgi:hypothetical protein
MSSNRTRATSNTTFNLGSFVNGQATMPPSPVVLDAPVVITPHTRAEFASNILPPVVQQGDFSNTSTNNPVVPLPSPPLVLMPIPVPLLPLNPIRYSTDNLTTPELKVVFDVNSEVKFLQDSNNGLSSKRPLIICNTQHSLLNQDLFEIYFQIHALKNDDKNRIKENILSSSLGRTFVDLKTTEQNTKENLLRQIDAQLLVNDQLDELKSLLSIKKGVNEFKTFFETKMLFAEGEYSKTVSTKMFGQFLIDFRMACEQNSFKFLKSSGFHRRFDTPSEAYDKSQKKSSSLESSLKSPTVARNGFNRQEQESFWRLFKGLNPLNSIAVLINFLSKELRVSKGLSKPVVRRKMTDFFKATNIDGNPFDNIFGDVGKTIFDETVGENSLSTLTQIKTTNKKYFILPFEQIQKTYNSNTFIPGSVYFIDSVQQSENTIVSFDNLQNYTQYLLSTIDESTNIINELLIDNTLDSKELLMKISSSFLNVLKTNKDNRHITLNPIISLVLMEASKNQNLKIKLFNFLGLAGLGTAGDDPKDIFSRAAKDNGVTDTTGNHNIALEHAADEIETFCYNLLSSNNKTLTDRTQRLQELEEGMIKNCLMSCVTDNTTTTNIFKQFLSFARSLDSKASIQGNELSYVLFDNTGRTRYNFISSSFLLLTIFEIYCAYLSQYKTFEFSHKRNNKIYIVLDFNKSNEVISILEASKQITKATTFNLDQHLFEELNFEENYLKEAINLLKNIKGTFSLVLDQVQSGFVNRQKTELFGFDKYQTRLKKEDLLNTNLVDKESLKALFNTSKTIEFFTIGIPSQLLSNLRTDNSVDSSLIKIKVFKKTQQYDDVVFKPQTFIFDMDLFSRDNNNLYSFFAKRTFAREQIKNINRYSTYLQTEEIDQMVNNHLNSKQINDFVELMTGVVLNENSFGDKTFLSTNDNEQFIKNYFHLIQKPLPQLTNMNIYDWLNEKTNNLSLTLIKNEVDLTLNLFSRFENLTTKKIFDRLFTIPVNLNSFEIDITKTNENEFGKKMLPFYKSNERKFENDFIFDDYFVTVELLERIL